MRRVLMAVVLAAQPGYVFADADIYAGLGFGVSVLAVRQQDLGLPGFSTSRDFESTDKASQQFLGFRYGEYLGIEAGFNRLGTSTRAINQLDFPFEAVDTTFDTSGYDFFVVGWYPINQEFSVFGKLGVMHWESTKQVNNEMFPEELDGDDLALGLGIELTDRGRFAVRLEAEYYDMSFSDRAWAVTISGLYRIRLAR